MLQAGYLAAKTTEQSVISTFYDNGHELVPHDEEYLQELKQMRQWEIEHFIRGKYSTGVITKQEQDKKLLDIKDN